MPRNNKWPIKLLASARGEGVLRAASGDLPVRYQFDTYVERGKASVSGSIDADATSTGDGEVCRLILDSGEEIAIVLIKPDVDGVDFVSAPSADLGG